MERIQTRSWTRFQQAQGDVSERLGVDRTESTSLKTPRPVLEAKEITDRLMRRNEQGDISPNLSLRNTERDQYASVLNSSMRHEHEISRSPNNSWWREHSHSSVGAPEFRASERPYSRGYDPLFEENRRPPCSPPRNESLTRFDDRGVPRQNHWEEDPFYQKEHPYIRPYYGEQASSRNLYYCDPTHSRQTLHHHEVESPRRNYETHGRRSMDTGPSVKINLPHYDGRTKWQTFIRQFESVTWQWNEERKLQHLLASLRGDAADFVFDLERHILNDYRYLVAELENRFITRESRETHVRQFYGRKFKRGETIREFASDLKRLIRKAYPTGINQDVREDMLLKQFFDGLEDEDLNYYVQYLKSPDTLDLAVELVYEYDDRRNIQRENKRSKDKSGWRDNKSQRERTEEPKVGNVNAKDRNSKVKSRVPGQHKVNITAFDSGSRLDELEKSMAKIAQSLEKFLDRLGAQSDQRKYPRKTGGKLNVLQDQDEEEPDRENYPHQEYESEEDSVYEDLN